MKKRRRKRLLYVDSSVFIYPVVYDPLALPEAARAKEKLSEIASGVLKGCTATLTWGELT